MLKLNFQNHYSKYLFLSSMLKTAVIFHILLIENSKYCTDIYLYVDAQYFLCISINEASMSTK